MVPGRSTVSERVLGLVVGCVGWNVVGSAMLHQRVLRVAVQAGARSNAAAESHLLSLERRFNDSGSNVQFCAPC